MDGKRSELNMSCISVPVRKGAPDVLYRHDSRRCRIEQRRFFCDRRFDFL